MLQYRANTFLSLLRKIVGSRSREHYQTSKYQQEILGRAKETVHYQHKTPGNGRETS